MSSSLNSHIVSLVAPGALRDEHVRGSRRHCLQLLLVLAGMALPTVQAAAEAPLAGLMRWGEGPYRRFGVHIYDIVLWANDASAKPPLALELTYGRRISGAKIVAASLDEMAALGGGSASLKAWGEQMASIFPDVNEGDRLLGYYRGDSADFYFNGRFVGRVDDPEFARRFFGIWLDPKTSAPELRAALLRRSAG